MLKRRRLVFCFYDAKTFYTQFLSLSLLVHFRNLCSKCWNSYHVRVARSKFREPIFFGKIELAIRKNGSRRNIIGIKWIRPKQICFIHFFFLNANQSQEYSPFPKKNSLKNLITLIIQQNCVINHRKCWRCLSGSVLPFFELHKGQENSPFYNVVYRYR